MWSGVSWNILIFPTVGCIWFITNKNIRATLFCYHLPFDYFIYIWHILITFQKIFIEMFILKKSWHRFILVKTVIRFLLMKKPSCHVFLKIFVYNVYVTIISCDKSFMNKNISNCVNLYCNICENVEQYWKSDDLYCSDTKEILEDFRGVSVDVSLKLWKVKCYIKHCDNKCVMLMCTYPLIHYRVLFEYHYWYTNVCSSV